MNVCCVNPSTLPSPPLSLSLSRFSLADPWNQRTFQRDRPQVTIKKKPPSQMGGKEQTKIKQYS